MELFEIIIKFLDVNLIFCLVPIILTLILIESLFKNKFETKKVLNVLSWIIIIYTAITMVYSVIGILVYPEEYAFVNRATGPYWLAYWIMLIGAWFLPLTLLIKKLAAKFWYVLFISICIKIGFYLERFVIIVTSFHRDYLPEKGIVDWIELPSFGLVSVFIQGFCLAFLGLGIFEILKRIKFK